MRWNFELDRREEAVKHERALIVLSDYQGFHRFQTARRNSRTRCTGKWHDDTARRDTRHQ
jgi:hypothetical protein